MCRPVDVRARSVERMYALIRVTAQIRECQVYNTSATHTPCDLNSGKYGKAFVFALYSSVEEREEEGETITTMINHSFQELEEMFEKINDIVRL